MAAKNGCLQSWWKQELPSEEEMEEGRQNLEKHDNKVDFIVTHSCATSTQALLGHGLYSKDYLNEYRIEQACIRLLRTDDRIYHIAEAVGYHDLDYFVNRFIAIKGCTPAKFRKQNS